MWLFFCFIFMEIPILFQIDTTTLQHSTALQRLRKTKKSNNKSEPKRSAEQWKRRKESEKERNGLNKKKACVFWFWHILWWCLDSYIIFFFFLFLCRQFDSFKSEVDHGCFKIDLFALDFPVLFCFVSLFLQFSHSFQVESRAKWFEVAWTIFILSEFIAVMRFATLTILLWFSKVRNDHVNKKYFV